MLTSFDKTILILDTENGPRPFVCANSYWIHNKNTEECNEIIKLEGFGEINIINVTENEFYAYFLSDKGKVYVIKKYHKVPHVHEFNYIKSCVIDFFSVDNNILLLLSEENQIYVYETINKNFYHVRNLNNIETIFNVETRTYPHSIVFILQKNTIKYMHPSNLIVKGTIEHKGINKILNVIQIGIYGYYLTDDGNMYSFQLYSKQKNKLIDVKLEKQNIKLIISCVGYQNGFVVDYDNKVYIMDEDGNEKIICFPNNLEILGQFGKGVGAPLEIMKYF